jgi:hypothetical protein
VEDRGRLARAQKKRAQKLDNLRADLAAKEEELDAERARAAKAGRNSSNDAFIVFLRRYILALIAFA